MFFSFHRDTLVVRSVKAVPKGGEIFNCYGKTTNERTDLVMNDLNSQDRVNQK